MEFDEVLDLLRALPGVRVVIASEDNGAPASSWGDAFATYAPDGAAKGAFPFATVVTQDVPGFDEASRLSRPGVFRLNLSVGRDVIAERADGGAAADHLNQWLPHPVYAVQGWISICSPAAERRGEVLELLHGAHQRAQRRLERS